MGIILAVRKSDSIWVASDSMTISGGSTKQTSAHVMNSEKIVKWGASYIGSASHAIWPLVLKSYIRKENREPNFNSKDSIFEELLDMHQNLKDKYHLVPDEDNDSFESSRFESLIINPHGIFKTYEFRSVQQFVYFAAIGSGAPYALGAMHALYDRLDSAEDIAKAALDVAVDFDDSSGLPGTFYKVNAK